jgi:uncharacterized protein
MEITIAGEPLHLLPERAVFWPTQRTLFVADVHIGKAESFRRLGVPVPIGASASNLQALTQLIHEYQVLHLVILGDLQHSRLGLTHELLTQLYQWRELISSAQVKLLVGNHDRHSQALPDDLNIELLEEPYSLGPFTLYHERTLEDRRAGMSGHIHPVVNLQGKGRDRARLPCFVQYGEHLVLPAFGEFTGGYATDTSALSVGDHVYVIGSTVSHLK